MRRTIPIIMVLLIIIPSLAKGAQPLEVLKAHIDQVIGILKDPIYQGDVNNEEQREKIWKVIDSVFDFNEMGKRAVATHWKRFTSPQKKEFSDLFARFLGNTYLGRIQGYQDEEVKYLDEKILTVSKALVKTTIVREDIETPVNYSMRKNSGTWKIYDVRIEGVSMVKNYRAQFSKVLMKKSPTHLIELLKEKIEKKKKKGKASKKGFGIW